MEVAPYPGILVVQDAGERIADHAAGDDDAHSAAGTEDRIQIVRDHHYRELQLLMQAKQQLVEGRGTDRIKSAGRLIQQQQARIERQRPRQCGALDHATGQLRGILQRRVGRQSDQLHL